MPHKKALAAGELLNATTRAHRDATKAATQAASKTSMDVQNAPAAGQTAGEGAANYETSHEANDAGRDAVGKRNRPDTGHLEGTGSAVVNEALDKASVGAND